GSGGLSANPFTAAVAAAADAAVAAAASTHSEGMPGYLLGNGVGVMGTGHGSLPPVPYTGGFGSPGYGGDGIDRSQSMVAAAHMAVVATSQLQPTALRTLEGL
ncbi:hypothetical protein VOLCADRAFT_101055, partial [Volvox carteri f. nagariensis]